MRAVGMYSKAFLHPELQDNHHIDVVIVKQHRIQTIQCSITTAPHSQAVTFTRQHQSALRYGVILWMKLADMLEVPFYVNLFNNSTSIDLIAQDPIDAEGFVFLNRHIFA